MRNTVLMIGYTKLFETILTSTIWAESNETRLVWITMLALRNRDNIVEASLPGLAHVARVPLEAAQKAIDTLSAPDGYSRTKEHEGRRIEAIDGGWLILNGEKYRKKMDKDERREYLRLKQREHRAKVHFKSPVTMAERVYLNGLKEETPAE